MPPAQTSTHMLDKRGKDLHLISIPVMCLECARIALNTNRLRRWEAWQGRKMEKVVGERWAHCQAGDTSVLTSWSRWKLLENCTKKKTKGAFRPSVFFFLLFLCFCLSQTLMTSSLCLRLLNNYKETGLDVGSMEALFCKKLLKNK